MKNSLKFSLMLLAVIIMSNCKSIKEINSNEQLPLKDIGSTGKITFVYHNQTVIYTTVRAADGKVWLQQNLGSDNVATSLTDRTAYGDLYVWGRWIDGHENRFNAPISQNTTAKPNNPKALTNSSENHFFAHPKVTGYWWIQGTDQDLWSNSKIENVDEFNGCDPCRQALGKQWKLASKEEWEKVLSAEKITDFKSAYNSNLKIPLAGYRSGADGLIKNEDKLARFWTNTSSNKGNAYLVNIVAKGVDIPAYSRSGGLSIRCVRK